MNTTHLPEAIVAATTAFALEVSTWTVAHPDCSLAELEVAVLEAGRRALPAVLHGALLATQRALAKRTPRCPRCRHAARVWDWRKRQVLTVCGRLRWRRPWAQCGACGHSFGAGDETLGIAAGDRRSAGVTALVVELGGMTAFREAAQLLTATTGLVVAAETVRRVTEGAGSACADADDAAETAYRAGQEPALEAPAPGTLVVETDGVMVRYEDGWHEAKIGVVGGWDTSQADGSLLQPSYVAAREESSAFAFRLGATAARRGALTVVGWHGQRHSIATLRPVVVLGDGAKWIWEAAAAQFGERTEIIDFYHAAEHLSTVAALLHGAGTEAASNWARSRRDELRKQGVAAILPHLTAPAGLAADVLAKLRTESNYFRSNAARMAYPAFRAAGLPIGSGAVEASAKHVVQQRLKRPGARWSEHGGRALLALRAHPASEFSKAA
jgi:Uncharacterised protein family (UPF0236)